MYYVILQYDEDALEKQAKANKKKMLQDLEDNWKVCYDIIGLLSLAHKESILFYSKFLIGHSNTGVVILDFRKSQLS